MTTTPVVPDTIEARLDAISAQLADVAAEVEFLRRRRESADDLRETIAPIAGEAFSAVSRELDLLRADGSLEEVVALLRRLVTSAGSLDRALAMLDSFSALAADAAPVATEAFAMLTERLTTLDERGYFDFAKHSAGVVERVITAFDEDDIDQLGDNVVLILQTVKEMTQPEVMHMLRRTATAVQSQQQAIDAGNDDTPSLFTLLRRMRDPEVRRGLARALDMLRSVAAHPDHERSENTKGDG